MDALASKIFSDSGEQERIYQHAVIHLSAYQRMALEHAGVCLKAKPESNDNKTERCKEVLPAFCISAQTSCEDLADHEIAMTPEKTTNDSTLVTSGGQSIVVAGDQVINREQITSTIAPCFNNEKTDALDCAVARLTAEIISQGYTTSRVFIVSSNPPVIKIQAGRISEVNIHSSDPRVGAKLKDASREIIGKVFYYPNMSALISGLRTSLPEYNIYVGSRRANANELNTIVDIHIATDSPKWHGQLAIRDDGGSLTGELRSTALVAKNSVFRQGDNLRFYGETNFDSELEAGLINAYAYYKIPIGRYLEGYAAVGVSKQQWVEFSSNDPYHETTFEQFYYLLGFKVPLLIRNSFTINFETAIATNTNSAFSSINHYHILPGISNDLKSGYATMGLSLDYESEKIKFGFDLAFKQGLEALTDDKQLDDLRFYSISPATSQSASVDIRADIDVLPWLRIRNSFQAQYAFKRLLPSMEFVLGADTGLIGFPSIASSSDNGLLTVNEIEFQLARWDRTNLVLAPYFGYGLVSTAANDFGAFEETLSSTGILLKLLSAKWILETGFIINLSGSDYSIHSQDSGLRAKGIYSKIEYRF